jgi:hypothetical protein
MRKARPARQPHQHVVEAYTRQDRDAIPSRLTVNRDGVLSAAELVAEEVEKRIVREPGLLQADHIRLPLIQPGEQPRHARRDRVDVPGRDSQDGQPQPVLFPQLEHV